MSRLARVMMVGLASLVISFSAQANSDADAEPTRENARPLAEATTGTAICGHVGELMAAQKALREKNREVALKHLKEARRLLATCGDRVEFGDAEPPALSI